MEIIRTRRTVGIDKIIFAEEQTTVAHVKKHPKDIVSEGRPSPYASKVGICLSGIEERDMDVSTDDEGGINRYHESPRIAIETLVGLIPFEDSIVSTCIFSAKIIN